MMGFLECSERAWRYNWIPGLVAGIERRGSGAADAIHSAGIGGKQLQIAAQQQYERVHAKPGAILRRGANLVVLHEAASRQPAAVHSHTDNAQHSDGGVRVGRAGPQVHHATLPPQIRQRQAAESRALLLLELANVGRRHHPIGLATPPRSLFFRHSHRPLRSVRDKQCCYPLSMSHERRFQQQKPSRWRVRPQVHSFSVSYLCSLGLF